MSQQQQPNPYRQAVNDAFGLVKQVLAIGVVVLVALALLERFVWAPSWVPKVDPQTLAYLAVAACAALWASK